MIVGTTIISLDGNSYYSPEFPRGGLAATFACDVTQVANSPKLTIDIETRNSEETTWTKVGSFAEISTVGAASVDLTGCKEILRFKYTFDETNGSDATVQFLMQAPSWRPY